MWERSHEDWIREVEDSEVVTAVRPTRGSAMIFDHRLCHDVEAYSGDVSRIIVRGDIIFEALDG